jgi:hypothetical protein
MAGLDSGQAKKGREMVTNQIRKQKKEEMIFKKRIGGVAPMGFGVTPTVGAPHVPEEAITPTKNLDPLVKARVRAVEWLSGWRLP